MRIYNDQFRCPCKRWWISACPHFDRAQSQSAINTIKFEIYQPFWTTLKAYAWRIWLSFFFNLPILSKFRLLLHKSEQVLFFCILIIIFRLTVQSILYKTWRQAVCSLLRKNLKIIPVVKESHLRSGTPWAYMWVNKKMNNGNLFRWWDQLKIHSNAWMDLFKLKTNYQINWTSWMRKSLSNK